MLERAREPGTHSLKRTFSFLTSRHKKTPPIKNSITVDARPGLFGWIHGAKKREGKKRRTVFPFTSLFVTHKEHLKSTAERICCLGDRVALEAHLRFRMVTTCWAALRGLLRRTAVLLTLCSHWLEWLPGCSRTISCTLHLILVMRHPRVVVRTSPCQTQTSNKPPRSRSWLILNNSKPSPLKTLTF